MYTLSDICDRLEKVIDKKIEIRDGWKQQIETAPLDAVMLEVHKLTLNMLELNVKELMNIHTHLHALRNQDARN